MISATLASWKSDGAVALITLTRPPLNVLSDALRDDLDRCLDEIMQETQLRAVVLYGAGGRAFSVGSDIHEFEQTMKQGSGRSRALREHAQCNRVAQLQIPVVAAIEGFCLGGGLELALACDIRIAAAQSRFALPEVRLGLFPSGGGTERLPNLIGRARAKELMLLGDQISAEQALALGIINRVVPTGEAQTIAAGLAQRIAELPAVAVRTIKRLVDESFNEEIEQRLERIAAFSELIYQTHDAREGRAAFLEKRPARFRHE